MTLQNPFDKRILQVFDNSAYLEIALSDKFLTLQIGER